MQNIAKALIEFQSKCPTIFKDKEINVKSYKFAYATYGNILQTIKTPMFESKLAFTFSTFENKFICRIMHESGEYFDTSIDMIKTQGNMQDIGSLLTYCKRYTLVLALGLDTDSDDDCNAAIGQEVISIQETKKPIINYAPQSGNHNIIKTSKKVSEAQIKRLNAIAYKQGWSFDDVKQHCKSKYGCNTVDLNMAIYDDVCNYILANKPEIEEVPF